MFNAQRRSRSRKTKQIFTSSSFTDDAVPAFSLQALKGSPARFPGLRFYVLTSTHAFKRQIATPQLVDTWTSSTQLADGTQGRKNGDGQFRRSSLSCAKDTTL